MTPWVARNLVYRPATWLRGEPVFRLLRAYEASQWWSREEISAAQQAKLRDLLRFAVARSRLYRARAEAESSLMAKGIYNAAVREASPSSDD